MMSSSPEAWAQIITASGFKQISTTGKKVKSKDCLQTGKFPVIDQGQGLVAGYINDPDKVIHSPQPLIVFGDHTRAVKWVDFDFVPGADGTKILHPEPYLLPRFAYYQLQSLNIPNKGYSRHFKCLKEFMFVVPPIDEQKVIADKLDALLAQVESTKARLDRIPPILKRFRQSVLDAAVSGRLTKEWRGELRYTDVEVGSETISIPVNWLTSNIGNIIDETRKLCYGVVQPGAEVTKGIPLIRVCDIQRGEIDWSNLRTISPLIDDQYNRSKVKHGDILVTIVGAIGRVGVVRNNVDANIARAVARISPNEKLVHPFFIHCWLSSPKMQWWLVNSSKEVARKTLNLKELKTAPVPLPPLQEQTEIVRRVDQLFAYADRIEQQVNNALERVNNLTQSILAKAFRGELTEQWRKENPDLISGDNSAEALLERIQAERAAMQPARKTRRKTAKA